MADAARQGAKRAADGRRIYSAGLPVVDPASWRMWDWCADPQRSGVHGFGHYVSLKRKTGQRADEELAVVSDFIDYVNEHIEPHGCWWMVFSADCAPSLLNDWVFNKQQRNSRRPGAGLLAAKTMLKYLCSLKMLVEWADMSYPAHSSWALRTDVTTRLLTLVRAARCTWHCSLVARRCPASRRACAPRVTTSCRETRQLLLAPRRSLPCQVCRCCAR